MMTHNNDTDISATPETRIVVHLTVTADGDGARLDAYLAEAYSVSSEAIAEGAASSLSRSAAARLCDNGDVTVNGKKAAKKLRLSCGDKITVAIPRPVPLEACAEEIPLDVVFEDDDIIVINKPSGMVVHPAAGNYNGTLVNALLSHCGSSLSGIGGVIRPGIVHRIDKDTSGLLVVAKNDAAHTALAADIKRHDVIRTYVALLCGVPAEDNGTLNAPIGRHPTDRKKMAVIRAPEAHAREAITHWNICERYNGASMVICRLETGRTHQIRVHMAYSGHPVLGDPVYGGETGDVYAKYRTLIHGQCLHAARLELTHPRTKELLSFTAPCPADMMTLINCLRASAGYSEPYSDIDRYTQNI